MNIGLSQQAFRARRLSQQAFRARSQPFPFVSGTSLIEV